MLLLVGLALYADVSALFDSIVAFRWSVIPLVLSLAFLNYVMRFVKWQAYLGYLHLEVPVGRSFVIFLSGLLLSVTPGKVGELLKSGLLKESYGIPLTTSAPVVFAERLTDFVGVMLLAMFGVASSGYGVGVLVGAAVVSGVMLAFLASRRLSLGFIRLFERLPRVGRFAVKLEELYESVSRLIRPWPLLWTTLLSAVAWFCECVGFWIVVNALPGVSVGIGQSAFIYAFATLFGAVTMLPGGLFATEGSLVGLLERVFKLVPDRAAATTVTLIIRFCTLWFAVLVGAVAFSFYRWRMGTADGALSPRSRDDGSTPAP